MTRIKDNSQQYTGSQRLVLLYRHITESKVFSATHFAEDNGIKYHQVYHYIKLLKNMGIPIYNSSYGEWKLGDYIDLEYDPFAISYSGKKFTRAQYLVVLYRNLIRGEIISPTAYARKIGVSRQTIYHQLDLLSQLGIPIVNTNKGWTYAEYMEE